MKNVIISLTAFFFSVFIYAQEKTNSIPKPDPDFKGTVALKGITFMPQNLNRIK